MQRRLEQVNRIVAVRERALDRAVAALTQAREEAAAMRRMHETALAAWRTQAERVVARVEGQAAELEESHDFVRAMRRRADGIEAAAQTLEGRVSERRSVVERARHDLRKVELWRDALRERARREALVAERKAADELGARHFRRTAERPKAATPLAQASARKPDDEGT